MTIELRMPKLGAAMNEGTLAEWLVADQSLVVAGTPLYRVETDKVDNEIEAPATGTLRQLVPEGAVCQVGTLLAEIH